jgi:hypothetical protein
VGAACGGGKVIYKGAAQTLDHEVAQNTTNFYAIFSVSGTGGDTVYSMGVPAYEAYTPTFPAGRILEPFSRTNSLNMNGVNRGQGWSGAWSVPGGGSEDFYIGTNSLNPPMGYPDEGGNSAAITLLNGEWGQANRTFQNPFTTTNLYLSWVMRVESPGSAQYAGIEMVGGAGNTTTLFRVGLPAGTANAGIQSLLHAGNPSSNSTRTLEAGVDYTFMFKHVKATKTGYLLVYTTNDIIRPAATDEPTLTNWHAVFNMSSVNSTNFRSLRLVAGGNPTPGTVHWDELRVANNWTNLFDVGRQPVWDGQGNKQWFQARNWVGDQLPREGIEVVVFYHAITDTQIHFNPNAARYNCLGLRFDYRANQSVTIDFPGGTSQSVFYLWEQGLEVQNSSGSHMIRIPRIYLYRDHEWNTTSTNVFTSPPLCRERARSRKWAGPHPRGRHRADRRTQHVQQYADDCRRRAQHRQVPIAGRHQRGDHRHLRRRAGDTGERGHDLYQRAPDLVGHGHHQQRRAAQRDPKQPLDRSDHHRRPSPDRRRGRRPDDHGRHRTGPTAARTWFSAGRRPSTSTASAS